MKRFLPLLVLALAVVLSSCQPLAPTAPLERQRTETPPAAVTDPAPTSTVVPEQESTLTVCTAGLPSSLFLYDGINTAVKRNVLSLIYEEPFDLLGEDSITGILVKVPSMADGDLRLEPVLVERGQTIVDAYGNLSVFKPGVRVRPSGCRGADCAVTWDGEENFQMDRMAVAYTIKENLTWSDRTPLTAADSVFSYQLASAPDAPGLKWAEARTEDVIAQDEKTVLWTGLPGFTTSDLEKFFWLPLPSHLLADEGGWSDLSSAEPLTTAPLSYGPFIITSWDATTVILQRNLQYYQAWAGLPVLDKVIFRAVEGGREAAWDALLSGECDVLDSSFGMENDPALMSEISACDQAELLTLNQDAWTQLVFGVQPAAYDDLDYPDYNQRPDFFGNALTRQAVAACVDKETLLTIAMDGLGAVWQSFLPPDESKLGVDEGIGYDPQLGLLLLLEAGWQDHDGDPQTPLQAENVRNVPAGTPFSVELLVSPTGFHQDLGRNIQGSLAQCGIEVAVVTLAPEVLYAPGPQGPLFGRDFDLALISWQPMPDLDCRFYMREQVPGMDNLWIGTNIPGFSDDAYDRGCSTAALALPEESSEALRAAEAVFLSSMPAVPLISTPHVLVTSAAGCLPYLVDSEGEFFGLLEYYQRDQACP